MAPERFETLDWLWCNGAQPAPTRFESVDVLGGQVGEIKVRVLIGQQAVFFQVPTEE